LGRKGMDLMNGKVQRRRLTSNDSTAPFQWLMVV